MKPTEYLRYEHALVQVFLTVAVREAQRICITMQVNGVRFASLVDFFSNFIDRYHHAKEERFLFPLLEKQRTQKESGPIYVMIEEHQLSRQRINAMIMVLPQAQQGVPEAIRTLHDNLMDYIEIVDAHISKENNVLFPLADRLLTSEDQTTLKKAFDEVEEREMGNEIHGKYDKLALQLSNY
jgi:hemerythrin-like domain-containing protein